MKYKAGDRVKIREDLIEYKTYGDCSFFSEMVPWRGQVVTIECCGEFYYLLKGGVGTWTDEMIEGLAVDDAVTHPSHYTGGKEMSEKEPEQILEKVFDLLRELENVKVKTEWPIPVVRDRQGKLTKNYTLKEWFLKDQEELAESLDRELSAWNLDAKPGDIHFMREGLSEQILEEECDRIHTIFSKLHQFGYNEEEIAAGIRRSNEKARERGLID